MLTLGDQKTTNLWCDAGPESYQFSQMVLARVLHEVVEGDGVGASRVQQKLLRNRLLQHKNGVWSEGGKSSSNNNDNSNYRCNINNNNNNNSSSSSDNIINICSISCNLNSKRSNSNSRDNSSGNSKQGASTNLQ